MGSDKLKECAIAAFRWSLDYEVEDKRKYIKNENNFKEISALLIWPKALGGHLFLQGPHNLSNLINRYRCMQKYLKAMLADQNLMQCNEFVHSPAI